jgi:hypothetical protein
MMARGESTPVAEFAMYPRRRLPFWVFHATGALLALLACSFLPVWTV